MRVETRPFGPDDTPVSLLGFGCGAVGGLMVRGTEADQERAISRAREVGINYFDTAVQYGDGASEQHLGVILQRLGAAEALIGTKVRLRSEEFGRIPAAVTASLEGSLRRLQRDHVDIFHLHNTITMAGGGESLSVRQVLEEVVPSFQSLRAAGKLRLLGLTAIGETAALQQVIDAGVFGSAQVVYNMLNPSAGSALPGGYPAQDYGQLFEHTRRARVGVVGIRVLAGRAPSGSRHRHPVASPAPQPIGSALSYETDLTRASRLLPLVTEGFAASLSEAAVRFAIARGGTGRRAKGSAPGGGTAPCSRAHCGLLGRDPLMDTVLDQNHYPVRSWPIPD
jgi:L-galactose dehydrogenase/L-glyceraldehyde 3-phosphate reductase